MNTADVTQWIDLAPFPRDVAELIDRVREEYPGNITAEGKLKRGHSKSALWSRFHCPQCGTQVKMAMGQVKKRLLKGDGRKVYCSRKCANEYYRRNHIGPNSISYKHGHSYNTGAHQRMRPLVLERDQHSCVLCGKSGYLDVHHINEEVSDNRPENLVTLCKSHHRKHHGAEPYPQLEEIADRNTERAPKAWKLKVEKALEGTEWARNTSDC